MIIFSSYVKLPEGRDFEEMFFGLYMDFYGLISWIYHQHIVVILLSSVYERQLLVNIDRLLMATVGLMAGVNNRDAPKRVQPVDILSAPKRDVYQPL